MEYKNFDLLKRFLKEEQTHIVFFFGLMCLVVLLDYLYGISFEAMAYTVILALFFSSIYLFVGYLQFYRRTQKRRSFIWNLKNGNCKCDTPLSLEEEEYQEVITYLMQQAANYQTMMLQEKNDSVDYYTTWIHQIKTPISVMQLILQEEDTREHRDLQAELFRIEQYVEMVLCYTRLGSDTNDLVLKELNISDCVRRSVRKYASQFIRKKIKLHFVPLEVRTVSDEKWVCFIIEQILSNAIKYTEEGEVSITISEDKKISIKDTGIGIAPEDLPRIFEKGFTGYNGREHRKSTGLGLFLAKQSADKLGIRLSVESVPGKGSEFLIDLKNNDFYAD